MSRKKGTLEFRYYEVPTGEPLLALTGERWVRFYGYDESDRLITDLHFHNLMEIGFCFEGGGSVVLEEETYPYTGGTVTIIPKNYPHTTFSEERRKCHWEYLFIDVEKTVQVLFGGKKRQAERMMECLGRHAHCIASEECPELAAVVRMILHEMRVQKEMYTESVNGFLKTLFVEIMRYDLEQQESVGQNRGKPRNAMQKNSGWNEAEKKSSEFCSSGWKETEQRQDITQNNAGEQDGIAQNYAEQSAAEPNRVYWSHAELVKQKKPEPEQISHALEYISGHYDQPFRIGDLAEACHMSETHFRRVFGHCMGMSPVDYINQVRVKMACERLKKTNEQTSEVAVKCGFASLATFNRNFKKITGISPSEWKKLPESYERRVREKTIAVYDGW